MVYEPSLHSVLLFKGANRQFIPPQKAKNQLYSVKVVLLTAQNQMCEFYTKWNYYNVNLVVE